MLTIGFDPSLRAYGWCAYQDSQDPRKRRVSSGYEGTLSLTVPVARFMHFRSIVRDLLNKYNVDAVGIESPAYGGGPFSENHFGLMMFSLEAVFEKRRDCVLFDPTTLKLLVGNARAAKMDMQRYVQLDTMDTKAINNNEADAYCIAKFTARFMALKNGTLSPEELSETEKKVFLSRSKKVKNTGGVKIIKHTAHVFRENSRFFSFSQIPDGDVNLPNKSQINSNLLSWLNDQD